MPLISALERQNLCELKANTVYVSKLQAVQGYMVRPFLKTKEQHTSFQLPGLGLSSPHCCVDLDSSGESYVYRMPPQAAWFTPGHST